MNSINKTKMKKYERLSKSASPVPSSESSSSTTMSSEESSSSSNSSTSSTNQANLEIVNRYEFKILPQFDVKTDSKIELICSLASLLNIRNLEQNSRILLDLSQSKENCDLLIQSKNNLIIIKIIYDEWHELFEYYNATKQNNLSFSIYENRKNLSNLLNRRLNARRLGEQALNNLVLSEYESNRNNSLKIDLLELVSRIVKFNETTFEHLISQIKSNQSIEKPFFNEEKIQLIKHLIDELYQKSLVDIRHKLNLIELGAAQVLCELIELVWIFDEIDSIKSDQILEITLNSIKILNILVSIKNQITIVQNLVNQLCSRRKWLTTIYKCLNKQLIFKPNYDFIKTVSILIKNLSNRLNENLTIQSARLDDNSLALLAFNEIKFSTLLTQYAVNVKKESDNLKPILSSLLNLSILSFDNKKSICHVNGSLELFINLLKSDNQILSKQIEEISISLLRTLSAYYSLNEKLRHKLRHLDFYQVLLNHSLTSSNLNIVANACNILWTMSSRSKTDQDLLISLGAETRLKALSYSSFDFISISCLGTLKNITSDMMSSTTSSLSLSKSSSNNSEKSLNLTDSLMSSSSASSSFSFQSFTQPILANRIRKQMLENKNEFQEKLNSFNLNKIIDTSDSSTSLSLTSICSTSTSSTSRSSSNESTSRLSSSSSSLAIDFMPKIKKNSYYLNENSIPDIIISKKEDEPKKVKRVTFSGKEILVFEAQSSSNESLCKESDENCGIEIIDEKIDNLNVNSNNQKKQPFSPPINLKYIKSNSILLNKSLFYNDYDDFNLDTNNNNDNQPQNCLLATCELYSNENKENNNLVLTANQKLESNASLSLLLEPAKNLITKMDANLNNNNNNKSQKTNLKSSLVKKTPTKNPIVNPPLPTRSTSLQTKNSVKQYSTLTPGNCK